MRAKPITRLRRLVQAASFVLLIYGAYLFKIAPEGDGGWLPALTAPEGAISTARFAKGNILWPSGDTPVLDTYPPSLVCRFNPRGGLFKACIVHVISENLTWRTPVLYLLPHLTFFAVLCFLFGRMWCGWVCPIGSLGDTLTALRRRLNVPPRRFPASFRHGLRAGAYALLAATVGISAFIGLPRFTRFQCYWFLPYCQVCPARLLCPAFGLIMPSWKDFSSLVTTVFTLLAWVTLGLFVAAFYWGRRVWCHVCPVGLVNSWFNRGCAVELHKKAARCSRCAACAEACPMGLTAMYRADRDVLYNQAGCILCFRCVEACPRDGCLSVRVPGQTIVSSRF